MHLIEERVENDRQKVEINMSFSAFEMDLLKSMLDEAKVIHRERY